MVDDGQWTMMAVRQVISVEVQLEPTMFFFFFFSQKLSQFFFFFFLLLQVLNAYAA